MDCGCRSTRPRVRIHRVDTPESDRPGLLVRGLYGLAVALVTGLFYLGAVVTYLGFCVIALAELIGDRTGNGTPDEP